MSRKWRRHITPGCSEAQTTAIESTFFIVRYNGPISFVLSDRNKELKTSLGNIHYCSCSTFSHNVDELCEHICWLLLKKFRIPKSNPLSWQLGMSDIEIRELLKNSMNSKLFSRKKMELQLPQLHRKVIERKTIEKDDCCPICMDEFQNSTKAMVYCRYGCGKNMHYHCLTVWAQHQTTDDQSFTCPYCRQTFESLSDAKKYQIHPRNSSDQTEVTNGNAHKGFKCRRCNQNPIIGDCYRCSVCTNRYYDLCSKCYMGNAHKLHSFHYRETCYSQWLPAKNRETDVVPTPQENEETVTTDKKQLKLMENDVIGLVGKQLGGNSMLISRKVSCKICKDPYAENDYTYRLPLCGHIFHLNCIKWHLTKDRATCPLCNLGVSSKTLNRRRLLMRKNFSISSEGELLGKKMPPINLKENFEGITPNFFLQGQSLTQNKK
ncbi:hypothetical protein SNEBB_004680 [Seison nebaliae]|nr:hypothetical protein SNEBB_004680 [Seison nebaliae]